MRGKILTYTLISQYHDKEKDLLDSFCPLILNTLPKDKYGIKAKKVHQGKTRVLEVTQIQQEILDIFEIKIPTLVLERILRRSKTRGFSEQKKNNGINQYWLTELGINESDKYSQSESDRRRVNKFLKEATLFIREKDKILKNIDESEVENVLLKMLKDHQIQFKVNSNDKQSRHKTDNKQKRIEYYLINFVEEIERSEPEIFNTFEDIVKGNIINIAIGLDKKIDIKSKFNDPTYVFFDTNFILYLLGLALHENKMSANELFSILKKEKTFQFKVFDFTIRELKNTIGKVDLSNHRSCSSNRQLRFDDLRCIIAQNLHTRSNQDTYINQIQNKLEKLGITVEETNIKINDYKPKDQKRIELLKDEIRKKGRSRKLWNINHDLVSIEKIIAKRQHMKIKSDLLEKSGAFFLSSDDTLHKYNYENYHKNAGTPCEVISDVYLTNYFWLKNPKYSKKLSTHSLLSVVKNQFALNKERWENLLATSEKLSKVEDDKQITEEDTSHLLQSHNFQASLYTKDHEDNIDEVFLQNEFEDYKSKEQRKIDELKKDKEYEITRRELAEKKTAKEKNELEIKLLKGSEEVRWPSKSGQISVLA